MNEMAKRRKESTPGENRDCTGDGVQCPDNPDG